jgi:hypothetical protein
MTEREEFINPIDPDKVAENPGLISYPHTVGGAMIRPEDMGKTISNALLAMDQQTAMQLNQIQEQIQLLYRQAQDIRNRTDVSVWIYQAEMGFDPLINHIYHLYLRDNGRHFLSMVSPGEWGRSDKKPQFVATVKLLADHTWEILLKAEDQA